MRMIRRFEHPDKPIGPFMSEADAKKRATEDGWIVGEDAGRGWRRLVPAPAPLEIVELNSIRALIERGTLVVAVGGGGIPVVRQADGTLSGRDAVIDKDAATCMLATRTGRPGADRIHQCGQGCTEFWHSAAG